MVHTHHSRFKAMLRAPQGRKWGESVLWTDEGLKRSSANSYCCYIEAMGKDVNHVPVTRQFSKAFWTGSWIGCESFLGVADEGALHMCVSSACCRTCDTGALSKVLVDGRFGFICICSSCLNSILRHPPVTKSWLCRDNCRPKAFTTWQWL